MARLWWSLDDGSLRTDGSYVQYKGLSGKLPKVSSLEY